MYERKSLRFSKRTYIITTNKSLRSQILPFRLHWEHSLVWVFEPWVPYVNRVTSKSRRLLTVVLSLSAVTPILQITRSFNANYNLWLSFVSSSTTSHEIWIIVKRAPRSGTSQLGHVGKAGAFQRLWRTAQEPLHSESRYNYNNIITSSVYLRWSACNNHFG